MSASTTVAATGQVTPRRVGIWGVQPGGPEGSAALVAALAVVPGDRIVDLAPGTGDLGIDATEVNIYAWTGICPERGDAEYLRASVPSAVTVPYAGTPDATGLGDAVATAVVSEGLLAALTPDDQTAVVAEAVRLLRPNGRLGLHELCVRDTGLSATAREAACESLAGADCGALHPRTETGWRALLEDAGLAVVSLEHVALAMPGRREILRRFGPCRGHAVWSRCGGAGGSSARKVISAQRGRFTGIVIVARRPYVGRLRSAG
jgi:hypothetical protein